MGRGGVVVVGSLNVDLTAFTRRSPVSGETVPGDRFTMIAGGKGLNQALAAVRMGAPTWMVGCVGEDVFGETVLGTLTAAGVDHTYVRPIPGTSTGVAHIRVSRSGGNDIVVIPMANGDLRTDDVDTALDALDGRATVLLVQLEIPVGVAAYALKAARARGMTTVLDPAPAPGEPLDGGLYQLTDIVTPNETEATSLTGVTVTDERSARQAAGWLVHQGCGVAVITRGAAGCVVARQDEPTSVLPAPRVEVVDSTAAGDAFTGALGSRLAAGEDLSTALRWAIAAGALTTTVAGASSAIPSDEDVGRFVAG
jgi:ribokinase